MEVSEITDFKDLDTTIKTTDSGQVSGGSSIGSHSPPGVGLVPPMKPPPRHLLPTKLKPSPGVKMHPTGIVPHFRGKHTLPPPKLEQTLLFFTANGVLS